MKSKILIAVTLVIFSAFAVNAYAAKANNGNGNQDQEQDQEQGTSTPEQQDQDEDNDNVQDQDEEQQGQINAKEHRSTVANFVQSLLQVADREGGIGQQVSAIAQQQNQSASTTIQKIEKVQSRSKIKTFFFGTDYKNLGALRSEIAQTRNRLEKLDSLMENFQDEADKTELWNQIQTLEQEQTKIESFIKSMENKFSLFGWMVKLFN